MTLFPCNECAKAIIQAGIQTIVYESDKYANDASTRASKRMLNAAGVRYYQYNPTGRKIEYPGITEESMKFLLAAINAKYIHSNPGVYSLRAFARTKIPGADIEIGEYTINHQMDLILQDIYRRKPDFIGFSCYIWNISYIMEIVRDIKKVLPEAEIWLGGPEVSYDAKKC